MSGGWAGSDRADRLPPDWPQRKAAVWKRDGNTCWWCGQPGADQIDHKNRGDDHSLENLGPIHFDPCHKAKSAAEGVEARRAIAAQRYRPREQHPGLLR